MCLQGTGTAVLLRGLQMGSQTRHRTASAQKTLPSRPLHKNCFQSFKGIRLKDGPKSRAAPTKQRRWWRAASRAPGTASSGVSQRDAAHPHHPSCLKRTRHRGREPRAPSSEDAVLRESLSSASSTGSHPKSLLTAHPCPRQGPLVPALPRQPGLAPQSPIPAVLVLLSSLTRMNPACNC